ncbi:Imm32 family immunity protein [Longimicrobium sp.]|uniref:Imm32 family immunity protein n=1 Tax=Longimicrobium sp. TaxID=2029185 RepID=UPI002ED8F453
MRYRVGPDDPERGVYYTFPVEPRFTSELRIGAYLEDVDPDPLPPILKGGVLQIELAGTPRALEALGTYLIALARLETQDPNPHEHIEDVMHEGGGSVHLIIRRERGTP